MLGFVGVSHRDRAPFSCWVNLDSIPITCVQPWSSTTTYYRILMSTTTRTKSGNGERSFPVCLTLSRENMFNRWNFNPQDCVDYSQPDVQRASLQWANGNVKLMTVESRDFSQAFSVLFCFGVFWIKENKWRQDWIVACQVDFAAHSEWVCVLSQAGSMKWEGQGVDALRWSEEKLAMYKLQFIAASYANEVCFVSCIRFWNQACTASVLFFLVHDWINQV